MTRRKRSKKTETSPIVYIIAIFILLSVMSHPAKPATFMTPTDVTYEWFLQSPYDSDINSRLIYKDTIASPIAQIGDYTITSQMTNFCPYDWTYYNMWYDCCSTYDISKDGVSLGTVGYYDSIVIDIDNNQLVDEITTDMSYIQISQAQGFTRMLSSREELRDWKIREAPYHVACDSIKNHIKIHLAEDSFDVVVQAPENAYFAGQYIPIDVIVTSKLDGDYKGLLTITYDMPTFFGDVQEVQSKYVDISHGQNIFKYVIPTEKVTERFNVTVKMDVLSTPDKISGVNDNVNKTIATIMFDPQIITLHPLPLTMIPDETGNCLEGYSLNPIGDICVADYVFDLSCYHIGCPKVEGTEYQCTSAGVCAETVYVVVFGECPEGTIETTNPEGEPVCIKVERIQCVNDTECTIPCHGITSACVNEVCEYYGECERIATCPEGTEPTTSVDGDTICIKTEIYEHIIQCEKNTDCLNPCEGIVSECVDGKCEYTGECNVITEEEIVEIVKEADIISEPYIGEIIAETVTTTSPAEPFGFKTAIVITLIVSIVAGLIDHAFFK